MGVLDTYIHTYIHTPGFINYNFNKIVLLCIHQTPDTRHQTPLASEYLSGTIHGTSRVVVLSEVGHVLCCKLQFNSIQFDSNFVRCNHERHHSLCSVLSLSLCLLLGGFRLEIWWHVDVVLMPGAGLWWNFTGIGNNVFLRREEEEMQTYIHRVKISVVQIRDICNRLFFPREQ